MIYQITKTVTYRYAGLENQGYCEKYAPKQNTVIQGRVPCAHRRSDGRCVAPGRK